MSTLLADLTVWVAKITLPKRDGSGSASYYFAQDYWSTGTLYTSNPVIYPLLAANPKIKRGVGIYAGIRYDVSLALYGKSHLAEHEKSFCDVLELYNSHNAEVEFRVYQKPVDTTAGAHSDSVNIRQVCSVIDSNYEPASGVLSLQCRDVWFKDKEISKKLTSAVLTNLDEDWEGEYGAIVFGEATVTADGLVIDAPIFDSQLQSGTIPTAKLFTGWTFPSHPNNGLKRLLVANQFKDQDTDDYVQVLLETDPQTAGSGDASGTPVTDPPNWPRDLTYYSRGVSDSPGPNAARILTAVRTGLLAYGIDRCADIIDGQHFYNASNPDFLSRGDVDFSFEIWLNFDVLHHASFGTIHLAQGDGPTSTYEWLVSFNTADDKIRFGISVTGADVPVQIATAAGVSVSTWYQVLGSHDSVGNILRLRVNNATAVTSATGASVMTRRNGIFHIGANKTDVKGLDGKAYLFRYWDRVITSTEETTLYNSANPLRNDELSDALKVGLRTAPMLNEPFGTRFDTIGTADLTGGSSSTAISTSIGYSHADNTLAVGNENGALTFKAFHAESLDSGNSLFPVKSPLAEATLDVLTTAIKNGTTNAYFQIDPPLVMAPDANYFSTIDWVNSNKDYYVLCYYDANGGSNHYARDKTRKEANWKKQVDVRLDMQFYYLGKGDDDWEDGTASGTHRYSYQHVEAKTVTLSNGQSHKEFNRELFFKAAINGLEDDNSGTYTGSSNVKIEVPADITRFTLMNADFGLGLTSAKVDTTGLTAARDAQVALGITHKVVLDSQRFAEQLVVELARQSRSIFYKTRAGKLNIKVPTPPAPAPTIRLSEAFHRGDFILNTVDDNDYSTIINEFRQEYMRDITRIPKDPALNRRSPGQKNLNALVLNPTESTLSDTGRQALATASQALYGKREHTARLDFFDDSTKASKIQNYFFDRWSNLQKRANFQTYLGDFYTTLDLFSDLNLQHTGLPASGGTGLNAKTHYQGTPLVCYTEGVPCLVWSGGMLNVQVYEVEEEGAWMRLIGETVSTFS